MNATNPNPLKTVCAWCKKVLHEGPPPVSHGICPDCSAKLRAKHGPRAKPATPTEAGLGGVEIDEAFAAQVEADTDLGALQELAYANEQLCARVRLAEQAEALARAERDLWRRAAMGHGIN